MRTNEIFKQSSALNKEKTIEMIIEHLAWGDSIPYVSGGNGGSGAGFLSCLSEQNKEELKTELESAEYNNTPDIAEDFTDEMLQSNEYQYCVQFRHASGEWMQFLLWD